MRRAVASVALALLAVELLDELVFGTREAAWPLVRSELDLSYAEVGVLLSVPMYASTVLEPVFGILGDSRWRGLVVAGGGLAVAAALVAAAASTGFLLLLVAFAVLYPATGAFVSLSQATLMDLEPDRREANMARWSVAGGVGAVVGPLALSGLVVVGLGWRELFVAFAIAAVVLVAVSARAHAPVTHTSARPSMRAALGALRRPRVVRWLVVLEFADLLMDVLLGFVALYLVDEVGASASVGGVAVAVWTGAGLVGGFGIVALLRRVDGLRYLRVSAVAAVVLYAAFLLVPGIEPKLVLLALLGLATAGWYSIPKARLYDALSGQSGAVMTLGSVSGMFGALAPLTVALVAERYGLDVALWFLLAGPLALLTLTPRRQSA